MLELNKLYCMDCMEGMAQFPDGYFDLAIVDPPYGITKEKWDVVPNMEYFDELFRVSKKQIIWGGNYFELPKTSGWVCWDKTFNDDIKKRKLTKGGCPRENMSDFELIWTSFLTKSKFIRFTQIGNLIGFFQDIDVDYDHKPKIHPTQKHIDLYRYLLMNYANPDMKIIDTHVGSGSSIIAFLDFGCDWIGFEIDEDYHKSATERIERHKQQLKLF